MNQEGKNKSSQYVFFPGTPKIIQWLIKYSQGLIKNETQANYLLLVVGILTILVAIILFFETLGGSTVPPEALERPEYGLPIRD